MATTSQMLGHKAKKKKQVASQSYVKGTILSDRNELIRLIGNEGAGHEIDMLQQQIYDDGTQSMTVKIHFNPRDSK